MLEVLDLLLYVVVCLEAQVGKVGSMREFGVEVLFWAQDLLVRQRHAVVGIAHLGPFKQPPPRLRNLSRLYLRLLVLDLLWHGVGVVYKQYLFLLGATDLVVVPLRHLPLVDVA